MCVCGALKITQQFSMSWTRFTNLRQEHVDTVTPMYQPSLNVLLGSQKLSNSDHRQIFLAVQDFLVKSKRFEMI